MGLITEPIEYKFSHPEGYMTNSTRFCSTIQPFPHQIPDGFGADKNLLHPRGHCAFVRVYVPPCIRGCRMCLGTKAVDSCKGHGAVTQTHVSEAIRDSGGQGWSPAKLVSRGFPFECSSLCAI